MTPLRTNSAPGSRRRIAEGELAAGAALPSVRELAAAEETTAATVSRAYRELAEAGVIVDRAAADGARGAAGRIAARVAPARRRAVPFGGQRRPGALSLLVAGVA